MEPGLVVCISDPAPAPASRGGYRGLVRLNKHGERTYLILYVRYAKLYHAGLHWVNIYLFLVDRTLTTTISLTKSENIEKI